MGILSAISPILREQGLSLTDLLNGESVHRADRVARVAVTSWIASQSPLSFDEIAALIDRQPCAVTEHLRTSAGWVFLASACWVATSQPTEH